MLDHIKRSVNPFPHTHSHSHFKAVQRLCEDRTPSYKVHRLIESLDTLAANKTNPKKRCWFEQQRPLRRIVKLWIVMLFGEEWKKGTHLLRSIDCCMPALLLTDEVDASNNIIANQKNKCTQTHRVRRWVHGRAICLPISSVRLQWWAFLVHHISNCSGNSCIGCIVVDSRGSNCRDLITAWNVIGMVCAAASGRFNDTRIWIWPGDKVTNACLQSEAMSSDASHSDDDLVGAKHAINELRAREAITAHAFSSHRGFSP